MNGEKTEYMKLKRDSDCTEETWRNSTKVARLLYCDDEDLKLRKQLAMNINNQNWISKGNTEIGN